MDCLHHDAGVISVLQDLKVYEALEKGCWLEVFNNEHVVHMCQGARFDITTICQYIKDEDSLTRRLTIMSYVIANLGAFLQTNWTGPPLEDSVVRADCTQMKDTAMQGLSLDGSEPYHLTQVPQYLWTARTILIECREQLQSIVGYNWLLARCLFTHQKLLPEKSPSIRGTVLPLLEAASKELDGYTRDQAIQFHLEAGYMTSYYYEYKLTQEHFSTAKTLSGIHIELTGALGKRTRFQQEDLAQLILDIKQSSVADVSTDSFPRNSQDDVKVSNHVDSFPRDLALVDDTVLNKIEFKENRQIPVLTSSEQVCVLAQCFVYQQTNAADEALMREESLTFMQCLLHNPVSWSVHMVALYVRSKLERDSGRRVERSLSQLEELVGHYNKLTPAAHIRLGELHSANLPPTWTIKKLYGQVLLSLGSTKAALDLFISLELWEEVISCYQRLGKHEKAESVIREELAKHETPDLWCHLGDVTRTKDHFETAWKLSNHRSSRAMKNLGYLYMVDKENEKCIECFEKSLALNRFQRDVWFSYGCVSLFLKKFDLSVTAFRRCVDVDPEHFEAWNNLASALVKQNKKQKAFNIYQEALKKSYENWKIWDNYMAVATDCGEFAEVIRSYHRLLDLKDKWTDAEVLGVLVLAVTEDLPAADGKPASSLRAKLTELFGRITSKVTGSADIWRHYAVLLLKNNSPNSDLTHRALQYLQKAQRCVTQSATWEKDVASCRDVISSTVMMSQTYRENVAKLDQPSQVVQLLSGVKMAIKGVMAKIKLRHLDQITNVIEPPDLNTEMSRLDEELDLITKLLEQYMT